MAEQQRRRTHIWWLSGSLAMLGVLIAIFAGLEYFILTLTTVALAVIITVLLGAVLARSDRPD